MTAASAASPLSVTTTSPLPLAPLNTPYLLHLGCNWWDRELHLERSYWIHTAQLAEPELGNRGTYWHPYDRRHCHLCSDRYRLGQPC